MAVIHFTDSMGNFNVVAIRHIVNMKADIGALTIELSMVNGEKVTVPCDGNIRQTINALHDMMSKDNP